MIIVKTRPMTDANNKTAPFSTPKLTKRPDKLESNTRTPTMRNFVMSPNGYLIASEKISPKLILITLKYYSIKKMHNF